MRCSSADSAAYFESFNPVTLTWIYLCVQHRFPFTSYLDTSKAMKQNPSKLIL